MQKFRIHVRYTLNLFSQVAWQLLLLQGILGQNLVPNFDFSEFTACPEIRGEILLAEPWYSPNHKTTDFAHECAEDNFTGIPANNWGTEYPASGKGYAGIRTWLNQTVLDRRNYREYLAVELLDSLQAGESYYVSFKVSVGDSARYTSDDLGLYFSHERIPSMDVLPYTPHIARPQGQIIFTFNGWDRISGQYQAQGGEKHLVIGNFKLDDDITLIQRNIEDGVNTTYFYIDEVIVEPCAPKFPATSMILGDSSICPGESVSLRAIQYPGAAYIWENGSEDSLRVVNQAGIYTLTTKLAGCTRTDSLNLQEAVAPMIELGPDTTLCPGERLLLTPGPEDYSYKWNDNATSLEKLIQSPGIYVVTATLENCEAMDMINIEYREAYTPVALVDTFFCEGSEVRLKPSISDALYQWSTQSDAAEVRINSPGNYFVEIETECYTATESFYVELQDCGCTSFVPNVFSPNGDGINDVFQGQFKAGIQDLKFQVFNRMGAIVFETNDPTAAWDGKVRAQLSPVGVYFWAASFTCLDQGISRRQSQKGYLSLLR